MQSLAQIKQLLESIGASPKRSLGQNFLVDHNLIRKLLDAADLKSSDLILEIGPGTGTMTEELLALGCSVIACELDDHLAALNAKRLPTLLPPDQQHRFQLIHSDCLDSKHALSKFILDALANRPFKLVSNLPYGAATPVIFNLLINHPECALLAVTIQKELADRLRAKPSTKDFGPISIIAALTCDILKIADLPPGCFWPQPDVTSAMLLLRRKADAPPAHTLHTVSTLCNVLFAQRRKQIGAIWRHAHQDLAWPPFDLVASQLRAPQPLSPTMRAEELRPETFLAIACFIDSQRPAPESQT